MNSTFLLASHDQFASHDHVIKYMYVKRSVRSRQSRQPEFENQQSLMIMIDLLHALGPIA